MQGEFSFKQACEYVRKQDDPHLIDSLDVIMSAAKVVLAVGAIKLKDYATAGLAALAVQSDLTKAAKALYTRLTKDASIDPLKRVERLQAAHVLIVYTSFFESLSQLVPELGKAVNLSPREKWALSETARKKLTESSFEHPQEQCDSEDFLSWAITLPHPADGFRPYLEVLQSLYTNLSQEFLSLVKDLTLWEMMRDDQQRQTIENLSSLPKLAIQRYEAQYYELARLYPEFAIWANLKNHAESRFQLRETRNTIASVVTTLSELKSSTDVGLKQLRELLDGVANNIGSQEYGMVQRQLANLYDSRVREAVIDDQSKGSSEQNTLVYPSREDAFVPQAFRVIHYSGKERLESDATWSSISVRNDVGAFLLSYLSSPHSFDNPLIILGHPGSGKSLLTQILAARLGPPAFTMLRVALRDVQADAPIPEQIEQQIRIDTRHNVNWAVFVTQLQDSQPVVILDGYDELLQASGKVHSAYLQQVQRFQRDEIAARKQPVRAIVTSRITLIDKAVIPIGATVVRLEEFDRSRQDIWTRIWNNANRNYFISTNNKPFSVPISNQEIAVLARQPLLLLMLAVYDSQGNPLAGGDTVDQTVLYNRLLRRFILRELRKEEPNRDSSDSQLAPQVEREMQRLGIAAIGMFNRRALHLSADDLSADLKFFQLELGKSTDSGAPLSEGELLLGSFFFVVVSKSSGGSHEKANTSGRAFEFLHNTFGEFLACDFISRMMVDAAAELFDLSDNPRVSNVRQLLLDNANYPAREWQAALIYTPLFSRPVVLQMMEKWVKHLANQKGIKLDCLHREFRTLVMAHLARILGKGPFPELINAPRDGCCQALPLPGHLAIYTVNLLLLVTLTCEFSWEFDENEFHRTTDGVRPWDQLVNLWRSWFSLENLFSLCAVQVAKRNQSSVFLTRSATGEVIHDQGVGRIAAVGETLADEITANIAGLFLAREDSRSQHVIRTITSRLAAEGIDVWYEALCERARAARIDWYLQEEGQSVCKRILREVYEVTRRTRRIGRSHAMLILDAYALARCSGELDFVNAIAEHYLSASPGASQEIELAILAEAFDVLMSGKPLSSIGHAVSAETIRSLAKREEVQAWSSHARRSLAQRVIAACGPGAVEDVLVLIRSGDDTGLIIDCAVAMMELGKRGDAEQLLGRISNPRSGGQLDFKRYIEALAELGMFELAWERAQEFVQKASPGDAELLISVIEGAIGHGADQWAAEALEVAWQEVFSRRRRISQGSLLARVARLAAIIDDRELLDSVSRRVRNLPDMKPLERREIEELKRRC